MGLEKGFYSSPRWSHELLDCSMPMTFDTYSNCAHQCVYCFAYFQRALGDASEAYLAHKVKSVNVGRVKGMFLDPDKNAGSFARCIKARKVMQWGGLSDGFDWYERQFRKSLELLRFFVEIQYPISISTKGVWWLDDPEYRAVIAGAKNVHVKVSIITADPEQAAVLEPGTPTPLERFEGLKKLRDLGVGATTMRFRPYIIGVGESSYERICHWASEAGCYSLTTEFLCIEARCSEQARERYAQISRVCGFDVLKFYLQQTPRRNGLLRLNYEVKRKRVEQVRDLCERLGVKFFISDCHHREKGCASGCCGLPDAGPLGNYCRGHFAEAILIARRNGFVRWADIAKEAELLRSVKVTKAAGFNIGTTRNRAAWAYQTMEDYMRNVWNNPKSEVSPARYFGGVLVPGGLDDDGDILYRYNGALAGR